MAAKTPTEARADSDPLSLEARLVRANLERGLFHMDPPPVTLGAYRIVRPLGAGGMGCVFEACDESGQRLAVKLLRKRSEKALASLKREFRAVADLHHRNLVKLYELTIEDGQPLLTMELIAGTSLSEYVYASGEVDPVRLRDLLRQLIDAVSTLHAARVIHRDLKPSNLLVQPDGRLVVLDFGLAVGANDPVSQAGAGTLRYMAPERLAGSPASEASDWYSVGMVLSDALERRPGMAPADERATADLVLLRESLLEPEPRRRPPAAELRVRFGLPAAPSWSSPVRMGSEHGLLLGREQELTALRDAYERARSGRSVLLHLRGEPGIGKTALLRHATRVLSAIEPACVLQSRCYEGERTAYNAVDGLIEALSEQLSPLSVGGRSSLEGRAELLMLFPALGDVLAQAEEASDADVPVGVDLHRVRQRAFAALRELVQQLAERRPVLICLDDLQWGDGDSARLLSDLLKAPAPARLLLIASYRSGDDAQSPCVQALQRIDCPDPADCVELCLAPLDEHVSLEVARAVNDDRWTEDELREISRQARGSPLFVRALVEQGAQPGARAEGVNLQALLLRAVFQLPERARELLELVALCGGPIERGLLLQAAQHGRADVPWAEQLSSLLRTGLVRGVASRGAALETYHDRVREAVAAALEPERRLAHHARLAAAAVQYPHADDEFVARHCEGAGQFEQAARHAELAGDRAFASIALEHATRLYAQALRCLQGARPAPLLEKLANATAYMGRAAQAAPLYREAAELDHDRALPLRLRATEMLLRAGELEAGAALARPILRALGMRYPATKGGAMASIVFNMARLRFLDVDALPKRTRPTQRQELQIDVCFSLGYRLGLIQPAHASSLLARSLVLATRAGTDAQLARALGCYAWMLATLGMGSNAEQDRLLDRAWEIACTLQDPDARAHVLFLRALTDTTRGCLLASLQGIREAQRFIAAHCADAGWLLQDLDAGSTTQLVLMGHTQELAAAADEGLRRARETGNEYYSAWMSITRAFAWLGCDEPNATCSAIDAFLATHMTSVFLLAATAIFVKAHAHLYQGDAVGAWQLLREHMPRFRRAGYTRAQPWGVVLPVLEGAAALACASQRLQGPYLRAVERAIAQLRSQRSAWAAPASLLLEAGLARHQERRARSAELYAAAGEGFEALSMFGPAAAARARQAELLEGSAALQIRARAEQLFRDLGIANPTNWTRMYAPVVGEL